MPRLQNHRLAVVGTGSGPICATSAEYKDKYNVSKAWGAARPRRRSAVERGRPETTHPLKSSRRSAQVQYLVVPQVRAPDVYSKVQYLHLQVTAVLALGTVQQPRNILRNII